jgi:hypothetical protein
MDGGDLQATLLPLNICNLLYISALLKSLHDNLPVTIFAFACPVRIGVVMFVWCP